MALDYISSYYCLSIYFSKMSRGEASVVCLFSYFFLNMYQLSGRYYPDFYIVKW